MQTAPRRRFRCRSDEADRGRACTEGHLPSASLLQIYEKSENSIRLVLLDEAFSKMTSDRIRPMMELFRRLQLQVLLISTVEKSTAIQPYCDITYSIVRHGDTNAIAPFVRLAAE